MAGEQPGKDRAERIGALGMSGFEGLGDAGGVGGFKHNDTLNKAFLNCP